MFFWFLAEPPPYIKIWFSQLYDSLHGGRIPKDSWCKVPYQLFGLVMNICLYILDSKVLYGLKTPTLPLLTLGFSNFVKRLSLFGFLLTNHFLSGYEIDNKFMSSRSCCIVLIQYCCFFNSAPLWGFVVAFMLFNVKGMTFLNCSTWLIKFYWISASDILKTCSANGQRAGSNLYFWIALIPITVSSWNPQFSSPFQVA